MASITVIIPAYNSAAFLEEAVKSALNQTYPPERIVIVDDGSPDNSYEIGIKLANTYPTVKVIQRKNGGAAAARNTGLAVASTDFVLFLDADDRLLPQAISSHLAAFRGLPNSVMVFGSNYGIDVSGTRISENLVDWQNVTLEDLAMIVTPCPSQCLYRLEALQKLGGLTESLRPGDEIDLNMRLLQIGEIHSYPDFVMEYRAHPGQGTNSHYTNARAHLQALKMNIGPGGLTPDARLYTRARRKWMARYGYYQYIAFLGAIRHGRWHQVLPALRLAFAGTLARMLGAEWRPGGR